MRAAAWLGAFTLAFALPAAAQTAAELAGHEQEWEQLLAAEDARARTQRELDVLLRGLRSNVPALRLVSVRALGRLERPDLLPHIGAMLQDSAAPVRAAAAHATAQAVVRVSSAEARRALYAALPSSRTDEHVNAAVAESLGRLRIADVDEARAVVQSLAPHLSATPVARLGVLRGLYFLARQQAARGAFDDATVARIRAEAAAERTDRADITGERVHILALMTLPLVGGADEATLRAALGDPSPRVRREAVAAAAALADTAALHRVLARAFDDTSPARYEAVRLYARRLAPTHGCAPLHAAARSADTHSALLAIDLLPTACAADTRTVNLADSLAHAAVPPEEWHRGAHALVALAALDPQRAGTLLPRMAASDDMFVRMYAARAAAALRDTTMLRRFAADTHPNVRTIAIQALAATTGRAADDLYRAALESDDAELLMAAAAALEGSAPEASLPALTRALARVTALRRETSRDPRLALLERIGAMAGAADAGRLRPYLRDFDEAVAAAAAEIIGRITEYRPAADPAPQPRLALPTFEDAALLETARVLIVLESGDTLVVRLLPFVAPTNAFRFARLARAGYYDGLTLHRIVYNFVVQGGSPGANEHTGDGPFTRDEVGAGNWSGSVGLSTRGRDTGDAQFYINHIDNVRLDHEYTIFAMVERGLDVVDALQEGARIRRVLIVE